MQDSLRILSKARYHQEERILSRKQRSRLKDYKSKKGNEAVEGQIKMEFRTLANAIDEGIKCAKVKDSVK